MKYLIKSPIATDFVRWYETIQDGANGIMAMARQSPSGRPRSARKPGERSTLSLRITSETFERLDTEAKGRGRPLSQEAERRIEQSFRDERLIEDSVREMVYGRQLAGVLALIDDVAKLTLHHAAYESTRSLNGEADWLGDPYSFDQFAQAVASVINALRPSGDPGKLQYNRAAPKGPFAKSMGRSIASANLSSVKDPELLRFPEELREELRAATIPEHADKARRIRALIGEKAANRIT